MRQAQSRGMGALAAASMLAMIGPGAFGRPVERESVDGAWRMLGQTPAEQLRAAPWVRPAFYQPVELNMELFADVVRAAPLEFTQQAFERPLVIEIPMPDGTFALFEVVESPVMEPGLAAKFPEIRTYSGQGITDPTATLRFDITPQGFHGQVLSADGSFYIDPFTRGDTRFYASYNKLDLAAREEGWTCAAHEAPAFRELGAGAVGPGRGVANRSGTNLRTYRAAVAATGEYTAYHGGTVVAGQAAIVTAINRVTGVYEREQAIRLSLVANNSNVVFTSAATDPYTNSNGGTMLGQNQTTLDNVAYIGSANYDIGHVFSTGGGGVAYLGVVCVNGNKAGGVTGSPSPTGDGFWIDYVAHEMGHQFGANHSFNGTSGSCGGGNRWGGAAYEPGSGSTIMAYAGICGSGDLQPHSDDYMIHKSFDEILSFSNSGSGNACPVNTVTGNTAPSVDAGPSYNIPKGTPFELTPASYGDINGDTLTFCWEERDLGAAQNPVGGVFADNGTSPFIRSFLPSASPTRVIPRVPSLIANTFVIGEALPATTRTINFRLTVRDNRSGGGGVNTDDMQVFSKASAGPFQVTSPNSGGTLSGTITVTWNVASTTNADVNCQNVDIYLSTDGGNSFPTLLLGNTPNDGSQQVTLPGISTSTARIKVKGAGNIFFDISNANFTIAPAPLPGAFSLTSPANGASNQPLEPTLAWTASSGAADYTVTVDIDNTFNPPFIYQTTTAATSAPVPPATLSNSTVYYWRVVANNVSGSTVGSPSAPSFGTLAPPAFCQGDADGDHDVDFADITAVLANFGASYLPGSAGVGDANNDGSVNFTDVTTVLANFGAPCP